MGWSVGQEADGVWAWHAYWNGQHEHGTEDTWSEAMGKAKHAFHYLEDNSAKPE